MARRQHRPYASPHNQHRVSHLIALGIYRYRWQLTPLFAAMGLLVASWTVGIIRLIAGWPWVIATYSALALIAIAWQLNGLRRTYDRIFAALVMTVASAWSLLLIRTPFKESASLYGILALSWPVLGLGWWCGPAFRSGKTTAFLRRRWANVAGLAGVAGARLTAVRETPVGRVLSITLPGDKTQREVSRERIESAYGARPGSVHVLADKANARRVHLHLVERDPWTGNTEVEHPITNVLELHRKAKSTEEAA